MGVRGTFSNLVAPPWCGGNRSIVGILSVGSASLLAVAGCARTDDDVGDRLTAIEGVYGEETTDGIPRGGRDSAGVETLPLNTSGPSDEPGVDGNGTLGELPNPANTVFNSPDTSTRPTQVSAPVETREPDGVSTEQPSNSGVRCGARAGDTCGKDEYCAYEAGQLCGAADAEATCKSKPTACTREYAPVCGCDGKTYGNACSAATAGTGVMDNGECPTESDCQHVQCLRAIHCAETCGGEIVQSGCCPCPDGMLDVEIDCRACGGFAGPACDPETEYCAYEAGRDACGALDVSAVCKPRPQGCTKELAPVCGCDGKTYSNECMANAAGTGVALLGACEG